MALRDIHSLWNEERFINIGMKQLHKTHPVLIYLLQKLLLASASQKPNKSTFSLFQVPCNCSAIPPQITHWPHSTSLQFVSKRKGIQINGRLLNSDDASAACSLCLSLMTDWVMLSGSCCKTSHVL